ncbi:hypothetical protein XFF6992_270062 [Xanthomonas citri pv. fuscans]|uniref:Uncharacterized protein n=1 Tax=Xanthomonas campestris pv. phaseoli TaxID=317013 RepID=A0A7Z7J3Z4_XANCH|nr:hypothetical protein XFF6990_200019 [Xanthomonas citri pv. fuscans]SOO18869.1 hypothetical protein XFF6992_270062 [Xanthomonas citri pv. fuscans]SOO25273.1 hypothetical protein XFF6991_430097 [Xanthomonas phaseoli pv. phaseoli]SOO32822.1 hypothetical protein XFF6994_2370002 [Xanthomonas citri pv. fuscans]
MKRSFNSEATESARVTDVRQCVLTLPARFSLGPETHGPGRDSPMQRSRRWRLRRTDAGCAHCVS